MNRLSKWVFATALIGAAGVAGAEPAWVRFSEDSQRIVVDAGADGISKFEGVSSAVCKLDGNWHRNGTKSHPLVAAGFKNCEISSVEALGDHLWKIHLTGRKWGTAQSFSLSMAK